MKVPTFINEDKLLSTPFKSKSGTILLAILAIMLKNKPLKKEELLGKIGVKHQGKTDGYLSNVFSTLRKLEILSFDKRANFRTWTQGARYEEYMGFILMSMMENESKVAESIQYRLMPKKEEQSVDFISSPTDDIFDEPNPYLED